MLTFHGVKVLPEPFFRICDLTTFNVHCKALCIGDCLDHNCRTAAIYGVLSVRVLQLLLANFPVYLHLDP